MASRMLNFRASDELAEAISDNARQSDLTISEWLRQLASQRAEATKMETAIHTRAAMGDGEAMSVLADTHYRQALDGSVPPMIGLALATTYARLAAMARGTREDWLSLVYIAEQYSSALREAGFEDMADKAQAEAVVVAETLAEAGDEQVARMIVASAEDISPTVMALAVRVGNRIRPDARLLPEADHLHATFPGWYGAPVLGGAKSAGLRNPNARN